MLTGHGSDDSLGNDYTLGSEDTVGPETLFDAEVATWGRGRAVSR